MVRGGRGGQGEGGRPGEEGERQKSQNSPPESPRPLTCMCPLLCHCKLACTNSTVSLMFGCKKYGQQEEDTPQDPSPPPLPEDSPELVQVSQKSLSQVESVHGYVAHAHISPIKVVSALDSPSESSASAASTLFPQPHDSPLPSCSSNPYPPIQSRSMLNSVWYAKKMGRRIVGTLRRTKRLHRRLVTVRTPPRRLCVSPLGSRTWTYTRHTQPLASELRAKA
uniref:Disks large homologue 1 N-terminal PEST domain-containing protein n=1 Tax=Knipowitschia caucasica TaxID=637954 RepID=A0AAV2JZH7_KNICA